VRRAAAACALLLWWVVVPAASADREQDLARLREAIDESRERVAHYESEERGLLEALEALDRSVALLTREARQARTAAAEARETLERVEAEAGDLAQRLERTRRAMSARAVALYKAGDAGAVRMLFAAGGVRDFLSRVQSLRLLLSHDAELLARHRAQERALRAAQARAEEAALRHSEAAEQLRQRQSQLASERAAKSRLARELGRSRARERHALAELETAARALETTLGTLQEEDGGAEALAGPPFATLRGRLPAPVEAPVAEGFGVVVDARHQTRTFRKGLEFQAPLGRPVRAVAAGRVRFAGWFRGYGQLVILDHGGDYFTVSGHLGDLAVAAGDVVAAGDPVGTVGDTGSLQGPRLYFEIRRGAEALDPADWLRALDAARREG
jgi:septal ring factor EnvC (AmiA/AmiB activator)